MSKFRKKPIEIDAEQWFPDRTIKGVHWERQSTDDGEFLRPYVITAHEQRAYLAPGDWIIPEPGTGRYYPCKPDIFAATYDPVEEQVDCPACEGGGTVEHPHMPVHTMQSEAPEYAIVNCEDCDGTGKIWTDGGLS